MIGMLREDAMFYPIKKAIACTIAAVIATLSVPLSVQAQEAKPAAQAQGAENVPRIGLQAKRKPITDC